MLVRMVSINARGRALRSMVRLQLRQAYPLKLEIRRSRSLVYEAGGQKPCAGGLAGLNAVESVDG